MAPPLGIIEGFFGPVWDWTERAALMSKLAQRGFHTYIYAPKGDQVLRRRWQDVPPPEWSRALSGFSQACHRLGVKLVVGLSPFGLATDLSESKLLQLKAKLSLLQQLGVKRFALLFDDMDTQRPDLAEVQVKITESIQHGVEAKDLMVCPSYYSSDPILDVVFGARPGNYLRDLGRWLDPAIQIFWTGPEVCARQISLTHLSEVGSLLQRKPLLWDNYPVNDGPRMSTQLHLRGFTGRDARIADHISGHMINPALQVTLTKIPALTLSMMYQRQERYDYMQAFDQAAEEVLGRELAHLVKQDLIALQDTGLARLDSNKLQQLRERYSAIDHPGAAEIVRWLAGEYAVSAETVQTQ